MNEIEGTGVTTEIDWVVEWTLPEHPGRPWVQWVNTGDDEPKAREILDERKAASRAGRTRADFRLVKRTKVVTDEVIETYEPSTFPEDDGIPFDPYME